MKRRTKLLLLLSGLTLGAAIWQALSPRSTAVTIAKENYAKLRLGMSEAEAAAVLGGPPALKSKLYGQWMEDARWYATMVPDGSAEPPPGNKLYDWHQWAFGRERGAAWAYDSLHVGAMFAEGRLVSFWWVEDRGNEAERWLIRLGNRLSLDISWLSRPPRTARTAGPPS